MSKEPPYFITEYKNKLFTVVGGNTIELPDGSKVVMNPDFVVSADYSKADDPVSDLVASDRKPPLPVANPPFGLPKANPDPKRKANT